MLVIAGNDLLEREEILSQLIDFTRACNKNLILLADLEQISVLPLHLGFDQTRRSDTSLKKWKKDFA